MTNLEDLESDSSDEEWVISTLSKKPNEKETSIARSTPPAGSPEPNLAPQDYPTHAKKQKQKHNNHHRQQLSQPEDRKDKRAQDNHNQSSVTNRTTQKNTGPPSESFTRRTPTLQKKPHIPSTPSSPKNTLFQLPQGTPIRISSPVPNSGTSQYVSKSNNASTPLNPSSPVFVPAKLSQPAISSALSNIGSKSTALSLQYVSDAELKTICIANNSLLLVTRLIGVYKNAEVFSRIREIETQASFIELRLKNKLHYCKDPCDFVLDAIEYLSHHAETKRNMTHKFRKQLCTVLCQAIHMYLKMSLERRVDLYLHPDKNRDDESDAKTQKQKNSPEQQISKEIDLITFDEEAVQPEPPMIDLITFNDDDDNEDKGKPSLGESNTSVNLLIFDSDADQDESVGILDLNDESSKTEERESGEEEESDYVDTDTDDDSNSESEVITIGQLMGVPDEVIEQISLRNAHQKRLLDMVTSLPSPITVYYALDAFKIPFVASGGCVFEKDGVTLAQTLIQHAFYDEAVAAIRKLSLFSHYPPETTATSFLTGGYGMHLPTLYAGYPDMQKQLLSFINKQLRFNFAGKLEIVPDEYLKDLWEGNDTTPQLLRLKERKFQKEIASCGNKVLKDLDMPHEEAEKKYYFITLSAKYACLRYLLAQRSIQQSEESDYSIEASDNFNGLIDLVCQDDPVLAKLCIKELIDTGDTVASPYFASRYKQQAFFCRYNSLPIDERLLGIVKGEQMSKHKSTFVSRKPPRPQASRYYELAPQTKRIFVDSRETLMLMKDILSVSNVCGLDSEWIPAFATKTAEGKTALMQIASDIDNYVFLVDLKTMYQRDNIQLYGMTEIILKLLFEDTEILKLAFDFAGDFNKLHSSIPSSNKWRVTNMVDLKNLKTVEGETIIGGLNGVVQTFLDANLSKKQQLSNWEQRPLSEAQCIYAAIDAVCILDVFSVLCQTNHSFVHNLPENFTKAIPHPSFPPA